MNNDHPALVARIAAAAQAARTRADSIRAAFAVIRKYKLRDLELLAAIQCIGAAIDLPQDEWVKDRLTSLACEIEDSNATTLEMPDNIGRGAYFATVGAGDQ